MNPATEPPLRRPTHYLHPGQLFASAEPYAVTTILGTCVSVCLWDPQAKVGGLNHYLLAYDVGVRDRSPRFGTVAIPQLLRRMLDLGASRERLRAKVFGGTCSAFRVSATSRDLGAANVELALRVLEEESIPIVARDTGGERARKLIFHLDEGVAWVRPL